ncbi:MAG: hypothetical protein JWP89_2482 [Schlesneria sp.]|nr:hypothetical protein [Schlesneria sp.]
MDEWARSQLRARDTAIVTALHTIGWPAAALFVVFACANNEIVLIIPALGAALGGAMLAIATFSGIIIGFIAYLLFSRSTISVKWMAFWFSLLFDLTVLGWVVAELIR